MLRNLVLASVLALVIGAPARAASTYFPGATWRDRIAETAKARPEAIHALEQYAFPPEYPPGSAEAHARRGVRTDGVVIVHRGKIVYERYARGYHASTPHLSWSVSKSFSNALVGVAVQEGKLRVADTICTQILNLDPPHCEIRLDHLLRWTSGLDWLEEYEGSASPADSSVISMLYGSGRRDMASFILQHSVAREPGTTFSYSTGDSTLLQELVRRAYGRERYASLPWDALFTPMDMTRVTWESDETGLRVGGAYLYATARDYARFGLLYLRDGVWNGRRLLPEGWVKYSTTLVPAFVDDPDPEPVQPGDGVPGAQFWINHAVPERGLPARWPSLPPDAFATEGHWGQYVFVVPSLDLVVVRLGDDRESGVFKTDHFLKLARDVAGVAR